MKDFVYLSLRSLAYDSFKDFAVRLLLKAVAYRSDYTFDDNGYLHHKHDDFYSDDDTNPCGWEFDRGVVVDEINPMSRNSILESSNAGASSANRHSSPLTSSMAGSQFGSDGDDEHHLVPSRYSHKQMLSLECSDSNRVLTEYEPNKKRQRLQEEEEPSDPL